MNLDAEQGSLDIRCPYCGQRLTGGAVSSEHPGTKIFYCQSGHQRGHEYKVTAFVLESHQL